MDVQHWKEVGLARHEGILQLQVVQRLNCHKTQKMGDDEEDGRDEEDKEYAGDKGSSIWMSWQTTSFALSTMGN